MKNKIVLFVAGCCVWLLSSCLDSDNNTIVEIAPDCQISSFSLKSDSVSGLSSVKFTIDQMNGLIFNSDSMPYGTVFKDKVTGTINYVNSSAVAGMQVRQEAVGDTIWWSGSDSLDFSKPVYFKVMAYDGMNSKEYKAWINVHQVVPDSMVWELYASRLTGEAVKEQRVIPYQRGEEESYYMYVRPVDTAKGYRLYETSATDVRTWLELPLTGLPTENVRISQLTEYNGKLYVPTTTGALYTSANGQDWHVVENIPSVKYLFGVVGEGLNQTSAMAVAVETADGLFYAAMNEAQEWTMGNEVEAGFPLTGFGSATYSAMYYEYLMVVAGRDKNNNLTNASWGTMDGLTWVTLSDEDVDTFEAREGVMVTTYDDKLFLMGGMDASGKTYKDIYTSTDYGVTWALTDSMVVFPDDYAARAFSSVQVNKEQFMFVIGGKTGKNTNEQDQVWRGRINRLGFE